MHIDLSGKRVIVTGASRGIGRAIARGFATEGARVAICARTQTDIDAVGAELTGSAAAVIARAVDVTDTPGVKAFVDEVAATWGGVDCLINNAGQGRGGNLDTLTPEQILEHANVLQMGHFRFIQAVVPHMRKQRWGRIVEINALAGTQITPDGIPSVANRAACIAMAKSLGMSLPKDNILVNTLNMGWIDTGQWNRHYKEMPTGTPREEFDAMVLKVVPLGRFGKPEDVVGMAMFLCSEWASFISAASIDIAGGMGGQIAYYPTLKREFNELMAQRLGSGAKLADPAAADALLRGKVAVITGASSGIGAAIARELAAAGMHLVVTARRADRLESLRGGLTVPCAALAADIEDPATPAALLAMALQAHGRADVLVNNAGRVVAGPLETVGLDDLASMTRVNFDSVVRSSYVFARHFKAQGSGAIVNVSSVGAYLSHSSMGVYGALKHALEVFTTALRVELKGSGVRVGSIAPGSTETEIFDQLRERASSAGVKPPPLAPADVAHAVRFMLERPAHANVARMLLVSAAESA